jgi:hypothetical protein
MRTRLKLVLAAALLVGAVAVPLYAQVANVTSAWVSGNLVFYDKAKNIIATFDGTNRKITVPASSAIDVASGALTLAAGEIDAADIATSGVATAEILDGTILNADIDAAAAIARSKLAEDALALYPIPIANMRLSTFAVMGVSAADDNEFALIVASNAITLNSDSATNTTDTSTFRFQVRLPENYVAAGDVSVRFRSALIESGAAATDNGSSIDLSCYEQADGAVGADIVSTAAQTYAATDTWYAKDFVITATNLVAGDILSCLATGAVIENNAGAETITLKTDPPVLLLDVKG